MRLGFNAGQAMGIEKMRQNSLSMSNSLARLSTGLRITKASDDAAGLSVSEQIRTQVRGQTQAKRNIDDSMALLQIAEGAMNEVSKILQKGRELAVQSSSDTLTSTDRGYLQQELEALMAELDRINSSTQYNGIKVLQGGVDPDLAESILEGLKGGWLAAAEALVTTQYGLSANGEDLKIIIENNGAGGTAAYVQGTYGGDGKAIAGSLELHIDAADFAPGYSAGNPSGGTSPFYADRIIAHEMVHAVMAVTTGNSNHPTWFLEGAAEYLHGAEERLWTSLGGDTSVANVQSLISANALASGWKGGSDPYSVAYVAARYLDSIASNGLDGMLQRLENGTYASFDAAIAGETTHANASAFESAFDGGLGATYVNGQADIDGVGTGAFNNHGATAEAIVADNTDNGDDDALANFNEIWESVNGPLNFQVGANGEANVDTIVATLSGISSSALDLADLSIASSSTSNASIGRLDTAINSLNEKRSDIGAMVNRLEHAANNLSVGVSNQQDAESRIRDLDFAEESTQFSKAQILQSSITSMMAQANANQQNILSLLG
jgi:flagellin